MMMSICLLLENPFQTGQFDWLFRCRPSVFTRRVPN